MPTPLSEQEQITLAKAAESRRRCQEDCDRANRALEAARRADDASLLATLRDPSAPAEGRRMALIAALGRRVLEDSSLLLALIDDPDPELAEIAIRHAPAEVAAIGEKLRSLLDHPDEFRWSAAAVRLAVTKDEALVARFHEWFRHGDQGRRNVAFFGLTNGVLLDEGERLAFLREAWNCGGPDDHRTMLAVGLLQAGDRVGWSFLVDQARRADDDSACWAAQVVHEHDPALGLELMAHILDHGASFRVRWGLVEKMAQVADLPHVWTADGLAEARLWVDQQREALNLPG
ncbi:hypothetical protein [Paludisphaera soli]|uniref:hypothetical protein n=1 Tax=Paludisphaera soli TaxID=2712865 RepID=UPI0013E9F307|nr:hypothetical protein [Paludisphaera soli]